MGFFDAINPFDKTSDLRKNLTKLDPSWKGHFDPGGFVQFLADPVNILGLRKGEGGAGGPPGRSDVDADARNQQQSFLDSLKAQAMGQGGPSAAQGQYQAATDANIRNAMALGQSQRGMGSQAALRGIGNQQAQIQQQSALESSILRAREQQQAQGLYSQALGGFRGQDLSSGQLNQNYVLGQQQMDNQMKGAVLNAGGAALETAMSNKQPAQPPAQAPVYHMARGGEIWPTGVGMDELMLAKLAASPSIQPTEIQPLQMGEKKKSQRQGLMGLAGTLLGTYFGGPAGGAAGNELGDRIGGNLANGGTVGGQAAYSGDSGRNDTVPAMLSPGEIVLPRTVSQDEDAPERAKAFVAALKKQKGGKQDSGALLERIARLESYAFGGCVK